MHFLLDANMPRSAGTAVQDRGHACTHVRDTPLRNSEDSSIAAHAKAEGLAIMTRDFDFADVRQYPPTDYAGIVVLALPDTATAATVTRLVESFLARGDILALLPGRLAMVEFGRIRLRPKPAEDMGGA